MARSALHSRGSKREWSRADYYALSAVTAIAGLLRFVRLTSLYGLLFDEHFYVPDACYYVNGPTHGAPCFTHEVTTVHPPLAKWIIGWGIEIFGHVPLGWRFFPALAGTLTVALLYLLSRKLLKSTFAAIVASGLLAFDFLSLVLSRLAMLDVFVVLFAVAALLFLVYDRDRLAEEPRGIPAWSARGWRPWRLAAGVMCGAALACKWSGGLAWVSVIVLAVAWEAGTRKERSRDLVLDRTIKEEGGSIAICLIVVPLLVYAASYAGRLDGALLAVPWQHGSFVRALWDRQFEMYTYHRYLLTGNSMQSSPWTWPLLQRPMPFYLYSANGQHTEVIAGGDPLVWWAAFVAMGYVAIRWFRERSVWGPEGAILASFLLAYPPWLVIALGRQRVSIYYMLPVIPVMCLALGYVAARLEASTRGRRLVIGYVVATVLAFAFYYPVLTAMTLSDTAWKARVAICDYNTRLAKASTIELIAPNATFVGQEPGLLQPPPPKGGFLPCRL